MKSLLLNIKNLLPYLILISIYFFFINIEARNDLSRYKNNLKIKEIIKDTEDVKSDINKKSNRLSIPVIPYKN